jgi:hypothetical protein
MCSVEHTARRGLGILAAIETNLQTMMKTLCTKTLVVVVVAVATVRSYLSLATQTRVLPQHAA